MGRGNSQPVLAGSGSGAVVSALAQCGGPQRGHEPDMDIIEFPLLL